MPVIELFSIFRVIAIFGSSSPKVDSSVSSVCSSLHIPHLTTTIQNVENEIKSQSRSEDPNSRGHYSFYLGPSQHDVVTMIVDIVKRLQWSNLAYITHRETGKNTFRIYLCCA